MGERLTFLRVRLAFRGTGPRLFWSYRPVSDRQASQAILANFLLHWFPSRALARSLSWTYSFWLGTIAATSMLLLVLTGVPLLFFYVPSVERAYGSIKDIEHVVSFGSWIRSMHRFSAHLMVAAVFAHIVRVFLTGAYKNGAPQAQRRQWNWVIGVALLLVTLLLSFSGYLLPWDQLAFWAVTIGTNIAVEIPLIGGAIGEVLIGGRSIDQATLIRFYVLHVFILPAIWTVLFCYHVWRIRKDGGLACADQIDLMAASVAAPPAVAPDSTRQRAAKRGKAPAARDSSTDPADLTVNASPDLARRLAVVMLGTTALLGVVAAVVASPLGAPANPLVTLNPAKSPWYFLWLQEVVTDTTIHVGPFTINGALVGGVALPGALLLLTTIWPWIDPSPLRTVGAWWPKERRSQNVVCLLVVAAILALTFVGAFMRGPGWSFYWPWQAWPDLPTRL
jgi:cytochrome b-561